MILSRKALIQKSRILKKPRLKNLPKMIYLLVQPIIVRIQMMYHRNKGKRNKRLSLILR